MISGLIAAVGIVVMTLKLSKQRSVFLLMLIMMALLFPAPIIQENILGNSIAVTTMDMIVVGMIGAIVAYRSEFRKQQISRNIQIFCISLLTIGAFYVVAQQNTHLVLSLLKASMVVPIAVVLLVWKIQPKGTLYDVFPAVGMVAGIIALLEYEYPTLRLAPWNGIEESFRATGFFTHPNYFAMLIGPLAAIMIAEIIHHKWHTKNLLWRIVGAMMAICALLLTHSSGAIIAVILVTVASIITTTTNKQRIIVCGILAAMGMMALLIPTTRQSLKQVLLLRENSSVIRKEIWHGAFEVLQEHPIQGAGIGGFQRVFEQIKPLSQTQPQPYPHNLYLAFWVEWGLIGLVLMFIGSMTVIQYYWKTRSTQEFLPLLAGVAVILLHGLVDTPYFHPSLSVLCWLIFTWGMLHNNNTPLNHEGGEKVEKS